jgi:predicted  nucleic acid-binding Zn-ribbon protein
LSALLQDYKQLQTGLEQRLSDSVSLCAQLTQQLQIAEDSLTSLETSFAEYKAAAEERIQQLSRQRVRGTIIGFLAGVLLGMVI